MTEKDWYSPSSISFTKPQIKFLIPILPILRRGEYLPNPAETGYIDPGGKPAIKPGAKFEPFAGIAAELDLRIQRAGIRGDKIHDGLLLEFLYSLQLDDEMTLINHIAFAHGISDKEVSQRIRNALFYISGASRKRNNYSQYIRDNRRTLKDKT